MSVFANSASLFMFRFFRVERLSLSAAVGRVSQRRMRLFSWMALKSFSKVSNRTALSSDAPLEDSTETCSLLQRYESPNNKECTMQGSGIKFVTKIASLLVIMVRRIFHKLGQHLKTYCAMDLSRGRLLIVVSIHTTSIYVLSYCKSFPGSVFAWESTLQEWAEHFIFGKGLEPKHK